MQEAIREVTRRIESEGHVARVCGLFLVLEESTCRAKAGKVRDCNHVSSQAKGCEGLRLSLVATIDIRVPNRAVREVQNNAYSMHDAAEDKKAHGVWPWA